jgi:hypothetical protein
VWSSNGNTGGVDVVAGDEPVADASAQHEEPPELQGRERERRRRRGATTEAVRLIVVGAAASVLAARLDGGSGVSGCR